MPASQQLCKRDGFFLICCAVEFAEESQLVLAHVLNSSFVCAGQPLGKEFLFDAERPRFISLEEGQAVFVAHVTEQKRLLIFDLETRCSIRIVPTHLVYFTIIIINNYQAT